MMRWNKSDAPILPAAQEFERTKHDFGQCPLIHDEDAKERWDALDDAGKERLGHEHALMKWLDQLMADLRAKIKKNTERLKAEQESPVYLKDDQVILCTAQLLEASAWNSDHASAASNLSLLQFGLFSQNCIAPHLPPARAWFKNVAACLHFRGCSLLVHLRSMAPLP